MTTSPPKSNDRRDGPRIDLRLRVRWSAETSTGTVSGEAEASDVSPKGLRLESEHKVDLGSALHLVVDVGGDTDELVADGKVMWCRSHPTPTGKLVYDVGVSFESDWLTKDRGPLGQALARIFAMNSYEPARTFERTDVSIAVEGAAPIAGPLAMVNLSVGGMQLKSTGALGDHVRPGMSVEILLDAEGKQTTLSGRVAWVAASADARSRGAEDRLGIEFSGTSPADKALLERVRSGQSEPRRVGLTLRG